jgi:hypothetical protein
MRVYYFAFGGGWEGASVVVGEETTPDSPLSRGLGAQSSEGGNNSGFTAEAQRILKNE